MMMKHKWHKKSTCGLIKNDPQSSSELGREETYLPYIKFLWMTENGYEYTSLPNLDQEVADLETKMEDLEVSEKVTVLRRIRNHTPEYRVLKVTQKVSPSLPDFSEMVNIPEEDVYDEPILETKRVVRYQGCADCSMIGSPGKPLKKELEKTIPSPKEGIRRGHKAEYQVVREEVRACPNPETCPFLKRPVGKTIEPADKSGNLSLENGSLRTVLAAMVSSNLFCRDCKENVTIEAKKVGVKLPKISSKEKSTKKYFISAKQEKESSCPYTEGSEGETASSCVPSCFGGRKTTSSPEWVYYKKGNDL